MALIPDRTGYRPDEPVAIELDAPAPAAATLTLTQLDRTVREFDVPAGATRVELGSFPVGGYGVTLGDARTAFDVLDSAFDRPRYGFVARLTEDADIPAVMRNFRRLHLSIAQFYDWAYKHSMLMPPQDRYVDPLGQERSLAIVNEIAAAFSAQGTSPLGYSAVYAVAHDELDAWEGSVIRRPDGEPYRLGDTFLVLVDPADSTWLEHYLSELERALRGTALEGFHLDQYGWPKFARGPEGRTVDLAVSFTTLLAAIRDRLPDARMMFNNVNDFPTYATATSPQDATYIEVWEPHGTLSDLGLLALNARRARPEHPPILSAYLSCYSIDEDRATNAAQLLMATAFSHGATHLLLGEHNSVLTGPYYPDNHVLAEQSLESFVPWYDFAVRYGDLLYGPSIIDVTETFTGGINGDIVVEGVDIRTSTKAEAGCLWTRVSRTPHGIVVHLINLTDQVDTVWDAGKNPIGTIEGLTLRVSFAGSESVVLAASVDSPDLLPVRSRGVSATEQTDALTAAQSSAEYTVPAFGAWSIILIPTE